MKKLPLVIAAVATLAALGSVPAYAENTSAEQQQKLYKILNKQQAAQDNHQVVLPRVQARATTFTRATTLTGETTPGNCSAAALARFKENRPERSR